MNFVPAQTNFIGPMVETFSVIFKKARKEKDEHHLFKLHKNVNSIKLIWKIIEEDDEDQNEVANYDLELTFLDGMYSCVTSDGIYQFEMPTSFTLKVISVPDVLRKTIKFPLAATIWHK